MLIAAGTGDKKTYFVIMILDLIRDGNQLTILDPKSFYTRLQENRYFFSSLSKWVVIFSRNLIWSVADSVQTA